MMIMIDKTPNHHPSLRIFPSRDDLLNLADLGVGGPQVTGVASWSGTHKRLDHVLRGNEEFVH